MKDEIKEMCHKCKKYPAEYNQTYCEFCLGISNKDDYITNLQEENERLKEIINQAIVLVNYINNLQERIDKATEYINKSIDNHTDWYNYIHGDEDGEVHNLDILLNILQGSDE